MAFRRKTQKPAEILSEFKTKYEKGALKGESFAKYSVIDKPFKKKNLAKVKARYYYVMAEAIASKEALVKSELSPHDYNYMLRALTKPVLVDFVSVSSKEVIELVKTLGVHKACELVNAMNKGLDLKNLLKSGKPLNGSKIGALVSRLGVNDSALLVSRIGTDNFVFLMKTFGPQGTMSLLKSSGHKFNRQRVEFLAANLGFVKKSLANKWSVEEIQDNLHEMASDKMRQERASKISK